MQTFHNNLNKKSGQAYQRGMLLITKAKLDQMKALEGAPSWQAWGDPTT
jgi:hypothetical protein